MAITLYDVTIPVFQRGLDRLAELLRMGEAWAEAEGVSPAELLAARLAPDMLTLVGQVQRASDTAKFAAVRIGGVANESFPDEERSFADLAGRIAQTRAFLAAVPRAAMDRNPDAVISVSLGRSTATTPVAAREYALGFAVPNFLFHVTTAYDILRSRGVPLGKKDFIGPLEQVGGS